MAELFQMNPLLETCMCVCQRSRQPDGEFIPTLADRISSTTLSRRRWLLAVGGGLVSLATHAEGAWPSRAVRVVVPYPPGGPTDITARLYAAQLQQVLKRPFVIDNRAGAGGEIGALDVARAQADGYTMLFGAIGSLAIHAVLPGQSPGYELGSAFTGVSMGSATPLAVAVRADSRTSSIQELIGLARARPASLTFGSAGNGSSQHMTGEYFQQAAGVSLIHVPYKGSAPAVNDLLGGQIDMVFETLPPLAPHLAGGRLKVLAVTSHARSGLLPEVSTLNELGLTGFDVSTYYGLLAPRATSRDIVDRLSNAMQEIARMPETRATLKQQGAEAVAASPEATDALIKAEVDKWDHVARLAKLK